MPESVPKRPKKANPETSREASAAACAAHLDDLKQAHGRPPADVPVPSRDVVRLVAPPPDRSYCTSPAQLCAELAE
jgi:hypothetical protein